MLRYWRKIVHMCEYVHIKWYVHIFVNVNINWSRKNVKNPTFVLSKSLKQLEREWNYLSLIKTICKNPISDIIPKVKDWMFTPEDPGSRQECLFPLLLLMLWILASAIGWEKYTVGKGKSQKIYRHAPGINK